MNIEKLDLIQLSSRQRMSPFPNYMSMECISKEMKNVLGDAYTCVFIIFKKNIFYVFFDKKDYDRVASHALKRVLEDPEFFHKIVEFIDKNGKEFVKEIKRITKKDVKKYTNKQLAGFHKWYEKKYKPIYSHYFTILAVERKLTDYLKDYLKKKVKDKSKIIDYFTILIAEPRAQINRREEHAALQLAAKIVKNKKWKQYFRDVNNIKSKIQADNQLNRLFLKHENDYFWITRDYEDPVLTYSDFIKRMIKILKNKPLKKLKERSEYLVSVDKNIRKIEQELKIDRYHSQVFRAMREGVHLKELRKAYVSQSLYYYDPILIEIARRSNINLNEARHLKIEEVESVFTDKKLQKELTKRVELSVYFNIREKTEVYRGKKAESLYKRYCIAKKSVKELKGFAASPGKSSGPVRIIMNPDELHKVKKGDIIVSTQIVPSFAPALKNAAGLVCDGGTGITSHPAILAREAKIPCVISTNIATQVLKNNDLVEVDGNKGLVKKID